MLPGNFTRGAKKLNGDGGADKAEGGGGGDNDADVTYFSPAKDVYEGDVIATRVAEEVRSVNTIMQKEMGYGYTTK